MEKKLIDGKKLSSLIKDEVRDEIRIILSSKNGIIPGLAVVLVGDDPASMVYVTNKKKGCEYTGINSFEYHLSKDISQNTLIELIEKLNNDNSVDGILVQLPLPKHIDSKVILETVSPLKDVDGFHPVNIGNLLLNKPSLVPCTPLGIIEMLDRYHIPIEGKNAVVVGRSDIVGKPIAALLLHRNATVTICHSKTRDIEKFTKGAEILIAAIGKPRFITKDMVSEGTVVIDVGINRVNNTLVGDVDFENIVKKALFITPVPGGVGPMTIAMLLKNTLYACRNRRAHK